MKNPIISYLITTILFALIIPVGQLFANKTFYPSDTKEGYIGIFEDKTADSPVDNVFTVELDYQPGISDEIWLTYELNGVTDHSGITRSINDQLAVGGYVYQTNKEWTEQKEQISPNWLKAGKNIVRFSLPDQSKHNYKVRKLGLLIKPNSKAKRAIVLNQPTAKNHSGEYGYIKGFVQGVGSTTAQLFANGKAIQNYQSEFEELCYNNSKKESWTVDLKAIFQDGETIEKRVKFVNKATLKINNNLPLAASSYIMETYQPGNPFMAFIDEVSLQIEPDALTQPTNISITALRDIDIPPLDIGMVNVTKNEAGYRFLPHGTEFSSAATLKLAYDENKIPRGYTKKDIKTYFFDEKSKHWIPLRVDSINTVEAAIVSKTTHFTDMINGIIKVPESPETGAFTPTSIKDIKAANPSANVNTIEPPSANNMGNANLSYPIVVPPGRLGMQPQLGIQYNSGGGNGWLGMGWDLSTPAVMVETRFGVPRYEADLETETYVLNGQQLAPVAFKEDFVERPEGDKQFYPRVEGNFDRIIRKLYIPPPPIPDTTFTMSGDTILNFPEVKDKVTANYWWQVTDKSGTVYSYGGTKDGLVEDAILRTDDDCDIAYWALVEVRDLNNNFVRYNYAKQEDVGVEGGTVPGYNVYVDTIRYTGNYVDSIANEGKYEVVFDRATGRKDVNIDCRFGLKKVTADLLRNVTVLYDGEQVRRYQLDYVEGAFFKTLLAKITEFDADDEEFNHHDFEYYDDVKAKQGYIPLNTRTELWDTGEDAIRYDIPKTGSISNELKSTTALGASKSIGGSIGLAATFGIVKGKNLFEKNISGGLNLTPSYSESKGLVSLTDINGDGLPDKVFKEGRDLYYRPNLTLPDQEPAFGKAVNLSDVINNFSKGISSTATRGGEIHFFAAGGWTRSTTYNINVTYFSDVNADQLIDIVDRGRVFFNKGNGVFDLSSDGTPCVVCPKGMPDAKIIGDEIVEQNKGESPAHDIVKVWIAPYDGDIVIDAPVSLGQPITHSGTADGVTVTIQHNLSNIWSANIGPTDYSTKTPSNTNRTVKRGDRIYFRVESVCDGTDDIVKWTPTITYDIDCPCNYIIEDYKAECNTNGTYNLALDLLIENSTTNNFEIIINGTNYGSFQDTNTDGMEEINLTGLPGNNPEINIVLIDETCENDYTLELNNTFNYDLNSVIVVCNDDDTYNLDLDVILQNPNNQAYVVTIDGIEYRPDNESRFITIENLPLNAMEKQISIAEDVAAGESTDCVFNYPVDLSGCFQCEIEAFAYQQKCTEEEICLAVSATVDMPVSNQYCAEIIYADPDDESNLVSITACSAYGDDIIVGPVPNNIEYTIWVYDAEDAACRNEITFDALGCGEEEIDPGLKVAGNKNQASNKKLNYDPYKALKAAKITTSLENNILKIKGKIPQKYANEGTLQLKSKCDGRSYKTIEQFSMRKKFDYESLLANLDEGHYKLYYVQAGEYAKEVSHFYKEDPQALKKATKSYDITKRFCSDVDANNLPIYQFNSSDDYLITSRFDLPMALTGEIKIEGTITKGETSDDITAMILKNGQPVGTPYHLNYASTGITTTNQNPVLVEQEDVFQFALMSETAVDWTQVAWELKVTFVSVNDPDIDVEFDPSILEYYPAPKHTIFNKVLQPSYKWTAPESGTITVSPTIQNQNVVFSIKKVLELVDKATLSENKEFTLTVEEGEEYYFDYHILDGTVARSVNTLNVAITQNDVQSVIPAGFYTTTKNYLFGITDPNETDSRKEDGQFYGVLYRNWGQFVYEANEERANKPIDESIIDDLMNSEIREEDFYEGADIGAVGDCGSMNDEIPENVESPEDIGACVDAMEASFNDWKDKMPDILIFLPLMPDTVPATNGTSLHYRGLDNLIYLNKDSLRTGRNGIDNININPVYNTEFLPPPSPDGKGAYAISIIRESKSDNFFASAGIKFSGSSGSSTQISDYFDMNGDRYPDIILKDNIHYTLPTGGLEQNYRANVPNFGNVQKSTHKRPFDLSQGGTFSKSFDANSDNSTKGEKSDKAAEDASNAIGILDNLTTLVTGSFDKTGFRPNTDEVEFDNMDINGDGLPDRVYKNGDVRLNVGYKFLERENWGYPTVLQGDAYNGSIGVGGINLFNGSIQAGMSNTRGCNFTKDRLIDMNGDGLLDIIGEASPPDFPIDPTGCLRGKGFYAGCVKPFEQARVNFPKLCALDPNTQRITKIESNFPLDNIRLISANRFVFSKGIDTANGLHILKVTAADAEGNLVVLGVGVLVAENCNGNGGNGDPDCARAITIERCVKPAEEAQVTIPELCSLNGVQQISVDSDYPSDNINVIGARSFTFSKGADTPNGLHTLTATVSDADGNRIKLTVLMTVKESCDRSNGDDLNPCSNTTNIERCVYPAEQEQVTIPVLCNLDIESQQISNVSSNFPADNITITHPNSFIFSKGTDTPDGLHSLQVTITDEDGLSKNLTVLMAVSENCITDDDNDDTDNTDNDSDDIEDDPECSKTVSIQRCVQPAAELMVTIPLLCELNTATQQISDISSDFAADNINILSNRTFTFSQGSGTPNGLHTLMVSATDSDGSIVNLPVLVAVSEDCGDTTDDGDPDNCSTTNNILRCVKPLEQEDITIPILCALNLETQQITAVSSDFAADNIEILSDRTFTFSQGENTPNDTHTLQVTITDEDGNIKNLTVLLSVSEACDDDSDDENDTECSETVSIVDCVKPSEQLVINIPVLCDLSGTSQQITEVTSNFSTDNISITGANSFSFSKGADTPDDTHTLQVRVEDEEGSRVTLTVLLTVDEACEQFEEEEDPQCTEPTNIIKCVRPFEQVKVILPKLCGLNYDTQLLSAVISDYPADDISIIGSRSFTFSKGVDTPNGLHTLQVIFTDADENLLSFFVLMSVDDNCGGAVGSCAGSFLYCAAPERTLSVTLPTVCNLDPEKQEIVEVTGYDSNDVIFVEGNYISYTPVDERLGSIVPLTVTLTDGTNTVEIRVLYCISTNCPSTTGEHDITEGCANENGNFEECGIEIIDSNDWINNELVNWYASHGSPSPIPGDTENNQVTMWMWSYNEGQTPNSNGEGIYTNYNFVEGKEYQLSFNLLLNGNANPAATFRVELANGLSPNENGATAIPVLDDSQRVLNQNWNMEQVRRKVSFTFVADGSYSQLWFYPYLNGNPIPSQAEAQIDDICLEDITKKPAPDCLNKLIVECTSPRTPVTICLDNYPRENFCVDNQNLAGISLSEERLTGILEVKSNTCFDYTPIVENRTGIIDVKATDIHGNSTIIEVKIKVTEGCSSTTPDISPKIKDNSAAFKRANTKNNQAKKRMSDDLLVRINTGNGFVDSLITWKGATQIRSGESLGTAVNAALSPSVPIPLLFLIFKIQFNPQVNVTWGLQKERQQIRDINGDGYPDYLTASGSDGILVKRSTIARTNLLKKVTRPLGAHFTLDYKRYGNTFDHPSDVWALSRVEVNDGFEPLTPDGEDYDGADRMLNTFTYEDGYYQRCEREFYGFKKVIKNQHDTENDDAIYRTATQEFYNNDDEVNGWEGYFIKGLLLKEMLTDANGAMFTETTNQYDLKEARTAGSLFPALARMGNNCYEGETTHKNTYMTYGYDEFGNMTNYYNYGDGDNALTTVMTYHDERGDNYVVGNPESIIVTGEGAYRERETDIDNRGNVTEIRQMISDTTMAVYNMTYDPANGNITNMTRPENHKGERMFFNYTYDDEVQTHLTSIEDAFGYYSSITYDYRFGIALSTTDLNYNTISYQIDAKGRIINLFGPLDPADTAVIQFNYHPEANPPNATTLHYDPCNPNNPIETITFIDGLKRTIQIKKDTDIFNDNNQTDEENMIVSGRLVYDGLGRTREYYYPITESLGKQTEFNERFDDITPTNTQYDVLDRALTIVLPDGATTTSIYNIDNDLFTTNMTDANGIQKQSWTDMRGLDRQIEEQHSQGNNILTTYKYNAIDEMIEVVDGDANITTLTYDWLGRVILTNQPNGGETKFIYDEASNLFQKTTANLEITNEVIEYNYEYERLISITYPQFPTNNVTYTYGNSGEDFNVAGKLVNQKDATGVQNFRYNKLGALVFNRRIVNVDECTTIDFTTEWDYDTWNRVKSITYPGIEEERETINYMYNKGGMLQSVSGNANYIQHLGYDKFADQVYLKYGNNTESRYTYESKRRRMKTITATTANRTAFMDCNYQYDAVSNILNVINKANEQSLGSSTNYTYEYDDLYRLIGANGTHGNNDTYSLSMSYTQSHSINTKNQTHIEDGVEVPENTYNNTYLYEGTQPHAPTTVGSFTYVYDANGNMTNRTNTTNDQSRNLIWDEENRLDHIVENGTSFHYTYDASGTRVIKHIGPMGRVALNGINQNTNTKARTGVNEDQNGEIEDNQNTPPCLEEYTVYVNPYIVIRNRIVTKHLYIENHRISSKLAGVLEEDGKSFTEPDNASTYFYHPDHLGSTSYITDNAGEISQHMEYLPYGEIFVEHNNDDTYKTPYLFNSKELDEETGLYYYGARYYDPVLSNWLSVDPLGMDFSNWSPYNYTLNNPIKYIDPDGNSPFDWVLGKDGIYYWDESVSGPSDTDLGGREYIGKEIGHVINHYNKKNSWIARNTTKGSSGNYTQFSSYYDVKIPQVVQDVFNRHKWRYDLEQKKDSRLQGSGFARSNVNNDLKIVARGLNYSLYGTLCLDGEEFPYKATLNSKAIHSSNLRIVNHFFEHPNKGNMIALGLTGNDFLGNYFAIANKSVGTSFPVLNVHFSDDATMRKVSNWYEKYNTDKRELNSNPNEW